MPASSPNPIGPPRDALLRRRDVKAAVASAALEGLTVPSEIRALLDQYADGTLSADGLVEKAKRIHDESSRR